MFVNMAMSRTHQPESLASNGGASVFTIEEIDERVQQLLAENAELRNTLQQNNTYMRLLINSLAEWHDEVDRIHSTYRDKFDKAKELVLQLKAENSQLREKLDSNLAHELAAKESFNPGSPTLDFQNVLDSFVMVDEKPLGLPGVLSHGSNLNECPSLGKGHHTKGKEVVQSHQLHQINSTGSTKLGEPTKIESTPRLQELEKSNYILNQQCRELSEKIASLNSRLSVAENLVLTKQTQNTELLMEVARLEKTSEVVPVLQAQLELYQSDFEAEREARQNLAGEKDAMAQEIRLLKRKLDALQLNAQASDSNARDVQSPQSYECPKCSFKYSTFESLNNHLDECLNQQMFPV